MLILTFPSPVNPLWPKNLWVTPGGSLIITNYLFGGKTGKKPNPEK